MIHEIGSIDKIYKIILVSGFSKDTYFIKGDIIDIINLIIDNKNIYQLDKIKNFENKNEYIEKNIEKIKEYNLNKKKK